jgi:hypothetical protein
MAKLNDIDNAFVKQYGATLDLVAEIKGGVFAGLGLEGTIKGEEAYYDQLGTTTASVVGESGTSTSSPDGSITHLRRKLLATNYEIGLEIDRFDVLETLINPESEYVQRQVSALMRKKDIEFITGALGPAATGKGGLSSADLGDAQTIDADGAGLTVDKIRQARSLLLKGGVNLDDPLNTAYLAVTPQQIEDLLNLTEATSADYMNVKTLVNGTIDSFYGFKIIESNLISFMDSDDTLAGWDADDIPKAADTGEIRGCFAWVKSGVRSATGMNIQTEVAKRADRRFNYYAYSAARFGSVRMEEKKVVLIECDEA